jgi:hypothetical protein
LREWYRTIHFTIEGETSIENILYPEDKPVSHLLEHITQRCKLNREESLWPQCNGTWLFLSSTLCENGFCEPNQSVFLKKPSADELNYLEVLSLLTITTWSNISKLICFSSSVS